jgi:transposase
MVSRMQGQQKYQPKPFVKINIEKLIPQTHLLRRIEKVIDLSFVRDLTKEYYCQNNGRPSIDPELFFRMILIGYIFNIDSDRKLCEEVRYNLAYRWYCKLNIDDFTPNHSSISRIRDRYGSEIFELFFDKIVDLCKQSGMVKGKRIITDGTLIAADASLDSMKARDADKKKEDKREIALKSTTKKLSNKTHISKTDSDSSLTKKEGVPRGLKYKAHISIDADSRVILDNKITTGSCQETTIYLERIKYIRDKYNLNIEEVVADRGYGSFLNISELKEQNITSYLPLWSSMSGKAYKLEEQGFTYNKENNYYECPAKQRLSPVKCGSQTMYYIKMSNCKGCSFQKSCSAKKRAGKKWNVVYRSLQQNFFEEQLKRMKLPEFQDALKERMWTIEGINAEIKNKHGLKRARYRGITKMQIQANMAASVLNIKRLIAWFQAIYNIIFLPTIIYVYCQTLIEQNTYSKCKY